MCWAVIVAIVVVFIVAAFFCGGCWRCHRCRHHLNVCIEDNLINLLAAFRKKKANKKRTEDVQNGSKEKIIGYLYGYQLFIQRLWPNC